MLAGAAKSYRFGEFVLDLSRGSLEGAQGQIELRPKSFEVLRYLVEHPDCLISKEELLQESALPGERYEVRDREIYNHLPHGVAGSLLTKGFFEKKPKVSYTGRNWRTVEKLAEL